MLYMNGIINLDWLAVSAEGDLADMPRVWQYHTVELQVQTPVWEKRAFVYNEYGDKVLTVLWRPRGVILASDAVLIEVANEWLYHGRGYRIIIDEFCWMNGLRPKGLSRVDVCCDFEANDGDICIINQLAEGGCYVGGKREGSVFWSINTNPMLDASLLGKKIYHCISWGKKSSRIKWKLYYKWKELVDGAEGAGWKKDYIVSQWETAGFNREKVWRLEVSISQSKAHTLEGMPMDWLNFDRDLCGLFGGLMRSRFVVRKNEGHKDRSNDKPAPLSIQVPQASLVKCRVYDGEGARSSMVTILNTMLQKLGEPDIRLSRLRHNTLKRAIMDIVRAGNLRAYASKVVGCDIEQLCEEY